MRVDKDVTIYIPQAHLNSISSAPPKRGHISVASANRRTVRAPMGLLAAGIALFLQSAMAQNPNSTTGTIVSIGTGWGGEGIYFQVQPTTSPACNGRVYMATSAIQYKENLSLAMLALAQNLPVTIYYGAACDSTTGAATFVSINLS